ncbi:guanine nucleotide-binding protein subunit alpha-11-like isoform X2 [Dunckerocampus dactyliophorus]|uniref:guanine nucleotide-binding protein subunit alpha-11-like isoform X2 n=1 Tax=Dunckerocampus dactyliophorus TaxID=161453 RepID=UPI002404D00F|nr:guanine nucleotide-binding protein subunit alpha-11-like isoform X2 [Dunckerocampus dactyliophorus]
MDLYQRMCTCCLSEEEQRKMAVNREIERILKQQKKRERREIKILLLGTGESGKTTFIRQMRIIHGRGFSEEDRRGFAKCIFQNILTAMKAMTGAMSTLRIPYSNPENEIYATWLQDVNTAQITQLERGSVNAIRCLWADSGIRVCYSRRCEYQLLDSTEYYMNNLERIAAPDYIPTEQDVLRVRFPTTGIHDYSFTISRITLRIVDVGGQKSERRKWIHCFENVTSLIFLASLSEYDQVLEEREVIVGVKTRRMPKYTSRRCTSCRPTTWTRGRRRRRSTSTLPAPPTPTTSVRCSATLRTRCCSSLSRSTASYKQPEDGPF